MRRLNHISAALGILMAAVFISVSCVNQEYDLSNVNTEMTIGGETIAFPLGSTEELKLGKMLDSLGMEGLVTENGNYSLKLEDSYDFSDQIPNLAEKIVIKDMVVTKDLTMDFGISDAGSLKVEGQDFIYNFKVTEEDLSTTIEMPAVTESYSEKTGLYEYGDDINDIVFDLKPFNVSSKPLYSIPTGITIPDGAEDSFEIEISLGDKEVTPVDKDVTIKTSLPEKISKVGDVKMSSNSRIAITLGIDNSFLTDGNIIPDLELDLSELMTIRNSTDHIIRLTSDFILTKENNYQCHKEFYIDTINIKPEDWGDSGELEMAKPVTLSGSTSVQNAKTTVGDINTHVGGMSLVVSVEYLDISVESVSMEIEPIHVLQEATAHITLNETELPEGVVNISEIIFTEESAAEFELITKGMDFPEMQMVIDDMTITFPEELIIPDAVDNKIVYTSHDLINPFEKTIKISGFNVPAPVGGKISYDGVITIVSNITASGRLNSSALPKTEAEDSEFEVDLNTNLEIEDYKMEIDGLTQAIDVEPEVFSFELPDGMGEFGTFNVIPEGNPVMKIGFSLPSTEIEVEPGPEGIQVELPDFIKFKDVDASLEFDYQTNQFTIKNSIPSEILLPVDCLIVTPEKDEQTGKYVTRGEVKVGGEVAIPEGIVSGKDVESLCEAEAKVSAEIPGMSVKEVSMERLSYNLDETYDFTILKASDIPAEVIGISSIDLGDAKAEFDMVITGLPELGSDMELELEVNLPDAIILEKSPAVINNNTFKISGKLKDGKFKGEPVAIEEIDLSGFDFAAKEDLVGQVKIKGSIGADSPKIDIKELGEGDILCSVNAGVKGIDLKRIEGLIDYDIEGINETIELNLGLDDEDLEVTLDFENPYIKLEMNTNVGIPVHGDLELIPVYNGVEDQSKKITASITLPQSDSHLESHTRKYWISGLDKGRPSDYEYIKADIRSLIKNLPEKINLKMTAGTDKSKTAIIEPSADYKLSLDYEFGVPFAFGEDFRFKLCDTLTGLGGTLPALFETGNLSIVGTVNNSIPLQFDLELEVLDSNNKVLELKHSTKQKIESCASDGTTSVSNLDLHLFKKEGVDMSGASSLKLTFLITSANVTGVPVNEDDFIQADISAMVSGGITFDLSNMNTEK